MGKFRIIQGTNTSNLNTYNSDCMIINTSVGGIYVGNNTNDGSLVANLYTHPLAGTPSQSLGNASKGTTITPGTLTKIATVYDASFDASGHYKGKVARDISINVSHNINILSSNDEACPILVTTGLTGTSKIAYKSTDCVYNPSYKMLSVANIDASNTISCNLLTANTGINIGTANYINDSSINMRGGQIDFFATPSMGSGNITIGAGNNISTTAYTLSNSVTNYIKNTSNTVLPSITSFVTTSSTTSGFMAPNASSFSVHLIFQVSPAQNTTAAKTYYLQYFNAIYGHDPSIGTNEFTYAFNKIFTVEKEYAKISQPVSYCAQAFFSTSALSSATATSYIPTSAATNKYDMELLILDASDTTEICSSVKFNIPTTNTAAGSNPANWSQATFQLENLTNGALNFIPAIRFNDGIAPGTTTQLEINGPALPSTSYKFFHLILNFNTNNQSTSAKYEKYNNGSGHWIYKDGTVHVDKTKRKVTYDGSLFFITKHKDNALKFQDTSIYKQVYPATTWTKIL